VDDWLSAARIRRTLAGIDEFVRSAPAWEMPGDIIGTRLSEAARKRCPVCTGHLVHRGPRIYFGVVSPGGAIVDLQGAPRSRQARLIGIGLRVSFVQALEGMTEEDTAFEERIAALRRLST